MKTSPDSALRCRSLALAAILLFPASAAHSAILVGSGGINNDGTVLGFAALPAATEWTTGTIAGSHSSYTTLAQIDSAVQTLTPGTSISTALASFAGDYSGAANFKHQSAGGHLSSSPTQGGLGWNALEARLQNNAGATIDSFVIGFDFGVQAAATEQVNGFVVYFNLTNNPAQWQQLGQVTAAGAQSFTITPAGGWLDGTTVYLLWADDNAQATNDGSFTLDNFKVSGVVAPEPGRAMLSLLGCLLLALHRRRA